MDLTPDLQALKDNLTALHHALRADTLERYQRMNPFAEDLFGWKERGAAWTKRDDNVTIYNSTTVVGDVQIGPNTWIGPYCSLDGAAPLRIGSWCSISLGCQLLTHDTVLWALSGGTMPSSTAPTSVGDNTFLGSHVVVTRGVTIGSQCVVGAGAVVTRDLPDRSIAVGVPARIVGTVTIESGKITLKYHDR